MDKDYLYYIAQITLNSGAQIHLACEEFHLGVSKDGKVVEYWDFDRIPLEMQDHVSRHTPFMDTVFDCIKFPNNEDVSCIFLFREVIPKDSLV
jgi:hypothetical protein